MLPNFLLTEVTAWVRVVHSPVCPWKPAGMERWRRRVACQQLCLNEKKFCLRLEQHLNFFSLYLCPLVVVAVSNTNRLLLTLYRPCVYLYVSIISPLSLRYFMLGRFMHFTFLASPCSHGFCKVNVTVYTPGTNFVALLSTPLYQFLVLLKTWWPNISKFKMRSHKSSKQQPHGFIIKILIWPDKAKDPVRFTDLCFHMLG